MDINSGRLISDINQIPEEMRHRFTPVPRHLQADAERQLEGRAETYISLAENSRLAAWAAKQRRKNRKREKIAKRSRARNRK